jgi:hypothetical protein
MESHTAAGNSPVGENARPSLTLANECKHIGELNAFFYLWTFFGKQNM